MARITRPGARRLLITASSIGLVFGGSPARGQEHAAPTEGSAVQAPADILVVARKRSERLIKVPESVQAITSDAIERAGIASLNDLGRQTPNVVLNRRQDNEPNVVIRGIGAFGNTQGIGFYVDDVQNFTDQSASIEDVERIEILKGPQGTLYGGSNIGGAVKYVMKRPGDELGFEGRAEYGTFDTRNLYAAANVPLDPGTSLAARLSGYWNHSDGFVGNAVLGTNPDRSNEYGVRAAVGWRPVEDVRVQLSYRHNELRNGGNVYVRTDNADEYRRTGSFNEDIRNDRTVDGAILELEYAPGSVVLTSLSSYTRRKTDLVWDLDYSPADAVIAFTGDRDMTHVYTQELRLTSDGSTDFDWIVGGYFAKIRNRTITNSIDLLLGPDAGGPFFIEGFNNADATERQYAAFGTANYRLGKFRIGGGLRVNRSEFAADLLNEGLRRSVKDTVLLPKLSLAYDVSEDLMLYANVARGFEPGKVNLTAGTGDTYDPETAMNYEVGYKGQTADRRFSFDVAAFYISYKDRQFETQRIIDGVVQEQTFNVGSSRSYGLEGGLSFRPTPELTFSTGAGYLHSKWRSGSFGRTVPDIDGDGEPDVVPVDIKNFRVPFAPEFSANASAELRLPIGDDHELGFRAGLTHMGAFYWDVLNRAKQKSYDLVDVRASFGSIGGGWEISLRAENLFDVGYYNEFNYGVFDFPDTNGDCDNCHLGAPGTPRRVLVALRASF